MTTEQSRRTQSPAISRGLWTRRRRNILETLTSLDDPAVADLYQRAVDTFEEQPLTPVALVVGSHCMRELVNRLPRILGEVDAPDFEGDGGAAAALARALKQFDQNPTSVAAAQLVDAARGMVDHRREASERAQRMRVALVLGAADPSGGTSTVRAVKKAVDAFEKYRHPQKKNLTKWPTSVSGELLEHIEVIERALDGRFGRFYDVVADLRAVLDEANTKQDDEWVVPTASTVRAAISFLPDLQHRRVFFNELRNPRWMGPLARAGVFADPPVHRDDAPYQAWPQGDYLRMMAAEEPEEAAGILATAFRDDVAWSVRELIVVTAGEVPAAAAAILLKPVMACITPEFTTRFIGIDAVAVVEKLASGTAKQRAKAKVLTRHLLEPLPDPRSTVRPRLWQHATPVSRIDEYDYEDAVRRVVAALGAEPDTLNDLAFLLAREQTLSGTYEPGGSDTSTIRRPSISRPRRGGRSETISDALIDNVRDCSVDMMLSEGLEPALKRLRRHEAPIFARIELHALAQVISTSTAHGQDPAPEVLDAAVEQLTCLDLAADRGMHRELDELAKAALPHVDEDSYLRWEQTVLSEPLGEQTRDRIALFSPDGVDVDDAVAQYVEERLLRRLATVGAGALRGRARVCFDELTARYGEVTESDIDRGIEWAAEPATVQGELDGLTPSQVLARVGRPPSDDGTRARSANDGWETARERDRLHRTFSTLVARAPGGFSALAERVLTLGPEVVSNFLAGLTESLRLDNAASGQPPQQAGNEPDIDRVPAPAVRIEWHHLLDAFAQTSVWREEASATPAEATPWRAVREDLCFVLEAGAADDIPDSLLGKALALASSMTFDSDPTPSREAEHYSYVLEDPVSYSINTIRSSALRTMLLLLAAHLSRGAGSDTQEGQTVSALDPVAAGALEDITRYLEPVRDPSIGVAAVFGEFAGWLMSHAPEWFENHSAQLMTPDAFGEAFLTTALAGHVPHLPLIEALEPGLRGLLHPRDSEPAADGSEARRRGRSTSELIGDRLTTLYLVGHIELTHPLLVLYNSNAPLAARAAVIGEIGSRFARSESVEPGIRDRAMTLWDSRMAAVRDGSSEYAELAEFESWVRCEYVPASWWLPRLIELAENAAVESPTEESTSKKVPALGFAHVGEALARVAENTTGDTAEDGAAGELGDVLHAFDLLIRANLPSRAIPYSLRKAAPRIIELALQSSDPAIQERGDDLLNLIGRHTGIYIDPELSALAGRRTVVPGL